MKYCFIFVCQQGELEIKSMLLAASLSRYLQCDYELVTALPTPETLWGRPEDYTLEFFQKMGARLIPITNQVDESYPVGNKVSCLTIDSRADKHVFLDSDILCLRPFSHQARFASANFHAKPADHRTFTDDIELWKKVYACVGLDLPTARVAATVSGELMPPYFNAGVIFVDGNANFGSSWLDCCRAIDRDPEIPNKRPWLDQVALPVAVTQMKLTYDCLDERFNLPGYARSLDEANLPFFCHYHFLRVIKREPLLATLVKELAAEHSELYEAIRSHAEWKQLLV